MSLISRIIVESVIQFRDKLMHAPKQAENERDETGKKWEISGKNKLVE